MRLTITVTELAALQANPLPWWSEELRDGFGLARQGHFGVELDDNEVPTGNLVISDRSIGPDEVHTLTVLRAAWAYAQANPEAVEAQTEKDWAFWNQIKAQLDAGTLTRAEAKAQVREYIEALGEALGVPRPSNEPDGDPDPDPGP